MKSRWLKILRRVVPGQQTTLHPIDQKLAKQWIKRRLAAVFPELRNNQADLTAAYNQLGLEPAGEGNKDDEAPTFEMRLPTGEAGMDD